MGRNEMSCINILVLIIPFALQNAFKSILLYPFIYINTYTRALSFTQTHSLCLRLSLSLSLSLSHW